jgi:hypothetical protein
VHLDRAAAFATLPNAAPSLPPDASIALRVRAAGTPFTDPAAQQIFGQLTQYYAANINQSFAIFWASLLAMIAGFIIIIVGIATAGANTATAIVAGVAGLLSQFIAATFLVALRSTQEQSTAYAQSLADLRSRDVRAAADAQATALGLELLGQIAGDGAAALVNQTRAALAMGLIVKQPPAEPTTAGSAPTSEPPPAIDSRARIPSVTFEDTRPATPPAQPG